MLTSVTATSQQHARQVPWLHIHIRSTPPSVVGISYEGCNLVLPPLPPPPPLVIPQKFVQSFLCDDRWPTSATFLWRITTDSTCVQRVASDDVPNDSDDERSSGVSLWKAQVAERADLNPTTGNHNTTITVEEEQGPPPAGPPRCPRP